MAQPTATRNDMLDAIAFTDASLHTAFPGTTGANEVAGGIPAYARQAITINAAAGAIRALNAAVTFDVPGGGTTVRWVGFWDSATFLQTAPNGGATPKNFMCIASTDLIYSAAHGYVDTDKIVFYNGTPPSPLVEGTTYFVRDSATDSFKVAATAGGAAIDLTTSASFGCVVCGIVEDAYAIQGTHQLSTASTSIPD